MADKPRSKWRHVFDVYRAGDGWRWRLWTKNGRIVAGSGEAYASKRGAVKACENIQDIYGSTIFVEGKELT